MKKPFIYLSAALSFTALSIAQESGPKADVIYAYDVKEEKLIDGGAAMAASVQQIVEKATPGMSQEMLASLKGHPELDLTSEQQAVIEKIMLANAQSLQIILDGFRANLETLVGKIKHDIYPVLTPRQQEVMKRIEAVQKAEIELIKSKMELEMTLRHKLN